MQSRIQLPIFIELKLSIHPAKPASQPAIHPFKIKQTKQRTQPTIYPHSQINAAVCHIIITSFYLFFGCLCCCCTLWFNGLYLDYLCSHTHTHIQIPIHLLPLKQSTCASQKFSPICSLSLSKINPRSKFQWVKVDI